jgi:prevent-host-death family protein
MARDDEALEVGSFEAKNRLSELLRAAEAGRPVVITRRGRAVARLVPIEDDRVTDLAVLGGELRRLRDEISGSLKVRDLVEEGRRW